MVALGLEHPKGYPRYLSALSLLRFAGAGVLRIGPQDIGSGCGSVSSPIGGRGFFWKGAVFGAPFRPYLYECFTRSG